MRAILFLLTVVAQLCWWDVQDNCLVMIDPTRTRRHVDRTASHRGHRSLTLASLLPGCNFRFEWIPPDLPREMKVVANHQSVIDIVAIMAAFSHHSVRFVAKKELRSWFPRISEVLCSTGMARLV